MPPSSNSNQNVGRGVPDVAADADPATGYTVRVDGRDTVIGGTSAVAPLWAGLVACLNQGLGKPVGFLNPTLYGLTPQSGVFRDITSGTTAPLLTGRRGLIELGRSPSASRAAAVGRTARSRRLPGPCINLSVDQSWKLKILFHQRTSHQAIV